MEGDNGDVNQHDNGGLGEDHVSIEMQRLYSDLALTINKKLDDVSPSPFGSGCCVCRVHEKFRKINEEAYTPEMVSIGPFHHGKERLKEMENHKLRYARALLSRTIMPMEKLEECVESLRKLEVKIRKCYSEPIDPISDNIVEMMLLDGLFIIELFRKSAREVQTDADDHIFNNNCGEMASLVRDMVLLENQLPMCVLVSLFKITMVNEGGHSLTKLTLLFFKHLMPSLFFDHLTQSNVEVLETYSNNEAKHLLDLLCKTFHVPPQKTGTNNTLKCKFLRSVTELRQAGVKFKKGSMGHSFLDIKFIDGVLEIPPILIQDQTDTLLRNFIASEQICDGHNSYMTSYAFLMDSLINSPNDVGFLRRHGIITSYLGDNEDVSKLFNKLCSEVTFVKFYYSELCNEVNAYCDTQRHVWRATLMRDYFNSPWAVLSIVAAIILLVLTLASTVFSVLSFFVHKS